MDVRREVALAFPGQGAQQPRMGDDLYGAEPAFTALLDEFFAASGAEGARLRDDWLSADPGPEFDEVVAGRPVKARQPFHSPLCADAAIRFRDLLKDVGLRPPALTIRSTCTARDVTATESVTPEFWSAQLAKPVLFWPAMDELLTSGTRVYLEAGPKGSCASVLPLHPAVQNGRNVVLPLLPATPGPTPRATRDLFDESVTTALAMAA
jgi:acyl transferase domain-containing protein